MPRVLNAAHRRGMWLKANLGKKARSREAVLYTREKEGEAEKGRGRTAKICQVPGINLRSLYL